MIVDKNSLIFQITIKRSGIEYTVDYATQFIYRTYIKIRCTKKKCRPICYGSFAFFISRKNVHFICLQRENVDILAKAYCPSSGEYTLNLFVGLTKIRRRSNVTTVPVGLCRS